MDAGGQLSAFLQDFATARLWYERAAAQGDSDARQALRELGRG